jgi:hypothetical protein
MDSDRHRRVRVQTGGMGRIVQWERLYQGPARRRERGLGTTVELLSDK